MEIEIRAKLRSFRRFLEEEVFLILTFSAPLIIGLFTVYLMAVISPLMILAPIIGALIYAYKRGD